jgi:hypothetical protein
VVAGAPARPRTRRLGVVGLLALAALLGAGGPGPAEPRLPLPPGLAARDRQQIEEIVQHAFASTQKGLDPYVVRPAIFEYLLDHPEFASHVTRALRAARYRIWREGEALWLDDGWGVKGTFSVVHAAPGLRIVLAQGAYRSALPDITGRAVVALVYKLQPAPGGRQQVSTTLTAFVQIDSAVVRTIGKVGGPLVQKKADREARQLLRVFAKVSRAIESNPTDVYRRLRERPDMPRSELEEFRKLLGVP